MHDYAVTIKCNKSEFDTYREDFKDVTDKLFPSDNFDIVKSVYELDSKYKLHMHLHLRAKYKMIYKNFMIKGWHIYIREIRGPLKKWHEYISKEPRTYDQLLQDRVERYSKVVDMFPLEDLY